MHSGKDIAFGPGKADLLEALQQTGSITKAAGHLGMSYMRAWTLIQMMNRCFDEPLVVAIRGGMQGGGGATLTKTGRDTLTLYRRMEHNSAKVVQADWKKFQKLFKRKAASRK
jgi:molybdate transport system regulatory protein